MADPTGYTVSYSFSGFQANSPTTPLPAQKVDNEFANIATAVASLVQAIKDVRRSDGALKNGSVAFEQLAPSLQLTFDPTNGELVAAAVAVAQAAAADAAAHETSAEAAAVSAENSATEAAASASTVNLALYLSKAGNLSGIGNPDTALANINGAKKDGSTLIGRLSPTADGTVVDWNSVRKSGWYSGQNAANQPPGGGGYWIVQAMAHTDFWITQIAYPFTQGAISNSAVTPFRRQGYFDGVSATLWQPWESYAPVAVGTIATFPCVNAPPGYLKLDGSLVLRATYPALYQFAFTSGNIVSEAGWAAGTNGAFSTGDLVTTFRLPDYRGEFMRGFDDGRGVDAGRIMGQNQGYAIQAHAHSYTAPSGLQNVSIDDTANSSGTAGATTGSTGGSETRPRNLAALVCIKT